MSRHYYAFYWAYGIGTVSAETLEPIGDLHRFGTEREQAEWVDGEAYEDGNVHRDYVDSRFARRFLEREFMASRDAAVDEVLGRGASCEMAYWRKAATIDQLWRVYNQ